MHSSKYVDGCCCRYYKGRNLLLERSRQTKRIYMPELRPKPRLAPQIQQQQQQTILPTISSIDSSSWMSLLAALPQQLTAVGFGPALTAPDSTAAVASVYPASTVATGTAATAGLVYNSTQAPETGTCIDGDDSRSMSRRLVVPAPAFIPLEPPQELLKAVADDSSDTQVGYRPIGAPVQKMDPEVLVQQVR